MKRVIFYFLTFILSSNLIFAQDINKKYFDKRVGSEILIDACNRTGLEEGAFGEIFDKQYNAYTTDQNTIADLKNYLENITIKMVFGSWCYDSKMQVPRFMKILDEIEFDENQLEIIAVDRLKKSHETSIDGLKIKYVPTFIVYRSQVEIGRIIENPKATLEQDLLDILN